MCPKFDLWFLCLLVNGKPQQTKGPALGSSKQIAEAQGGAVGVSGNGGKAGSQWLRIKLVFRPGMLCLPRIRAAAVLIKVCSAEVGRLVLA